MAVGPRLFLLLALLGICSYDCFIFVPNLRTPYSRTAYSRTPYSKTMRRTMLESRDETGELSPPSASPNGDLEGPSENTPAPTPTPAPPTATPTPHLRLSDSEIGALVAQRDQCRQARDFQEADRIKCVLGGQCVVITDIAYKQGGGSTWAYSSMLKATVETKFMHLCHSSYDLLATGTPEEVLVAAFNDMLRLQCYGFSTRAEEELGTEQSGKSVEMQGRKYADAAFELCMAGVSDAQLYNTLADCTVAELRRFGQRPSCKVVHIMQMIEKLAVAGVRGHPVFAVAGEILTLKVLQERAEGSANTNMIDLSLFTPQMMGKFGLFSDRPLLWLWRYATKQKKPTKSGHSGGAAGGVEEEESGEEEAEAERGDVGDGEEYGVMETEGEREGGIEKEGGVERESVLAARKGGLELPIEGDAGNAGTGDAGNAGVAGAEDAGAGDTQAHEAVTFGDLFSDPSLPLVIDLGCGYGVSLLSLSGAQGQAQGQGPLLERRLNFLGVDLSHRAVTYANGISSRFGYKGTCAFRYMDCCEALRWVLADYPGPVLLAMVNFPTPYSVSEVLRGVEGGVERGVEGGVESGVEGGVERGVEGGGAGGETRGGSGEADSAAETEAEADAETAAETATAETPEGGTNGGREGVRGGNGQLPEDWVDLDGEHGAKETKREIERETERETERESGGIKQGGNGQLPGTFDYFMCNAELVSLAARVLGKRGDAAPIFLIQSNVEDVAVTMRNIVQCSLNTCAGEARFVTPRRGQMAALMGGIFQQPFQPDGVGEGGPTWDWVALEELGGVGRTSQRLQMWLDDLAESAESAESAERAESAGGRDVDASCESVSLPRLHPFAARSRACGEGWLPLSPLPHARTETEVHCAFDKKPVHRVAFTLDGLTE